MMTHQDRMSKIGPSKEITDKPVAAFGGGKYRTPQAAGQNGKSAVAQQEAFSEVREAFRRVKEVHGGSHRAQYRQLHEMQGGHAAYHVGHADMDSLLEHG